MRTHHALQPRTPEQASYSIGRRDGKQFLKLYRSYLHGTLAGAHEPVYEGTVVEGADDWRLTAVLALAPMTLAFAYLIVMLFFVFREIYWGRWKRFGAALLPVLLWGTYLLGPVMAGRYIYPFVCVLPVLAARPERKKEA